MEKVVFRTSNEINQQIDDLAREYDGILPGEPRRAEIAIEISRLRLKLQNVKAQITQALEKSTSRND
jgi:hypothetical protein